MGKLAKKGKNLLFGEDLGVLKADPISGQVMGAQSQGMDAQVAGLKTLSSLAKEDPTALVKNQVSGQIRNLGAGVEDVRRQTEGALARRGLGNTSLGLAPVASATQRLQAQQEQLRSSIPERIAELRMRRAQALMTGGNDIVSSQDVPIRMRDEDLGRSKGIHSGITQTIGTIFGGIYGGPMGAKAGGKAGKAGGEATTEIVNAF